MDIGYCIAQLHLLCSQLGNKLVIRRGEIRREENLQHIESLPVSQPKHVIASLICWHQPVTHSSASAWYSSSILCFFINLLTLLRCWLNFISFRRLWAHVDVGFIYTKCARSDSSVQCNGRLSPFRHVANPTVTSYCRSDTLRCGVALWPWACISAIFLYQWLLAASCF